MAATTFMVFFASLILISAATLICTYSFTVEMSTSLLTIA